MNNLPVDTNTYYDWIGNRIQGIGQSDFPYVNLESYGEITCFVSPDSSYNAIVNALRKVNTSVYLNVYEFTSPFLCDEIIVLLKRNVSVYIFLEGSPVGGISNEEKYILHRIVNYGGKVRFIVNDPGSKIYARYRFNHGKYLIIDNETVIVESCNWADSGVPKNYCYGNREWGVIIKNKDCAEYFLKVFFDDWNPTRCDSWSFASLNLSIPFGFYMDDYCYKGSCMQLFEPKIFTGNFTTIPAFSPDTSVQAVYNLIKDAEKSVYVQQLYIYKYWDDEINPFLDLLINKSQNGCDVRVIMNYNPFYASTADKCNLTKLYLEEGGVRVRFHFTNWSYFSNIHNKGVIVDNKSFLISSINWNENSFLKNREAGVIVENESIAKYFSDVFFYDWKLKKPVEMEPEVENEIVESSYENTIYIVIIYTMTFLLIAQDWRKRKWK